jgi:hypothetical protein
MESILVNHVFGLIIFAKVKFFFWQINSFTHPKSIIEIYPLSLTYKLPLLQGGTPWHISFHSALFHGAPTVVNVRAEWGHKVGDILKNTCSYRCKDTRFPFESTVGPIEKGIKKHEHHEGLTWNYTYLFQTTQFLMTPLKVTMQPRLFI